MTSDSNLNTITNNTSTGSAKVNNAQPIEPASSSSQEPPNTTNNNNQSQSDTPLQLEKQVPSCSLLLWSRIFVFSESSQFAGAAERFRITFF